MACTHADFIPCSLAGLFSITNTQHASCLLLYPQLSPQPGTAMTTRPIIFLDIDGVLNRTKQATHIRLDSSLMEIFRELVDRTDALIVLSTFWRHFVEYISYILERHGIAAEKVIGATPGCNRSMAGRTPSDEREYTCRAEEIKAWLRSHPQYENFVILDDRPSAADSSLQERFILCQTDRGLTQENVEQAIRILSSQQRLECR